MNFVSLMIAGMIGVYGVFEFLRREHGHKVAMEYLRRGAVPPSAPRRPPLWKLVSLGIVDFVLLLLTMLFVYMNFLGSKHYVRIIVYGICFASLFLMVLLILLRDVKAYRKG